MSLKKKIKSKVEKIGLLDTRDAARMGLQASVAAATQFGIMQSLSMPEKFVGILSTVLVIEKSIGASIGNSISRISATLAGCAIGVTCIYFIPYGYGTMASLAISMFAMNAVAAFRPQWSYGVVSAVALALGSQENLTETAIDRSLAIGLGVVIGSLAALVIWPEKASTRAHRLAREAYATIKTYLDQTIDSAVQENDNELDKFSEKFSQIMADARACAKEIRIDDKEDITKELNEINRLYHSIIIVERVSNEDDSDQMFGDSTSQLSEEMNECLCDAIGKLADNEVPESNLIADLQDKIDAIHKNFGDYKDNHDVKQDAFVFALNEVQSSLKRIIDLR